MKKICIPLLWVALLAGFLLLPKEIRATVYTQYTDVAKIYNYGSCPGMQGMAVGSQMLYTVKVDSTNTNSFISMTDKDSGSTTMLYNADNGSYLFDYLGHANDMDVWGIDDSSNLFVINHNVIYRLKRSGSNLTKVASYNLLYNGASTSASAISVKSVSDGVITFITKLGMELYTGTVSTSATSADIELTKLCSLSKSKVYMQGQYVDLSSYVNQGMDYQSGMVFVPISGDESHLNSSVILVYNLEGAVGTILPSEALVFQITCTDYPALLEIESCGICSDGKLYFNTNRRKTDSDTNHDGISYVNDYTFVKLTEPAKSQTYTVRYNANGGTGTMEDTTVVYGVGASLRPNAFTRHGCKFAGWTAYRTTKAQWYYTNGSTTGWYAEGSQPEGYTKYVYKDGVGVSATTSIDGDVVILYAQWEPSTYTARYDANGGTGTMEDTLVTYGVGIPLRTNTFTRTGYSFGGWTAYRMVLGQWYYKGSNGTGWYTEGAQPSGYEKAVYPDGAVVSKSTGTDGDIVIFHAIWIPNTYTVTFVDADGTVLQSGLVAYDTVPAQPEAPTKENHVFMGWDKEVVACTGDTVYTATYEPMADPTITPKYPSLSFEGEIFYNVYFTVTGMDSVPLTDMGLIAWNTPETNGTVENAYAIIPGAYDGGNGMLRVRSNGIPAKKLGDTLYFKIYAKLPDGSYLYSGLYNYSAKDYALDRLANSSNAKMKALCVAMLNYGAAAQTNFNYKPYAMMNASLTAKQQSLVSAYDSSMIGAVGSVSPAKAANFPYSGFSSRYPSVSFEGAFAISYYFTPSHTPDNGMKLYYWDTNAYANAINLTTANASGVVDMALNGSAYQGTVEGIAAKEIDNTIYVAGVYTCGGVTYTTGVLPYSLGEYCRDRIANGSAGMQAFATATAVYGYYAKQYFAT